MLLRRKCRWSFAAAELKESNENDANPGRGWYRIYTYPLQVTASEEEMNTVCCEEEQLALLLIDIGWYRNKEIDQEALINLRSILNFFRRKNKELILRIVYDREGKGMEHEPSGRAMIHRHMQQLGEVLKEYADIILTLQGLFVGSWGEMHESRYLSKEDILNLTKILYSATEGKLRLSVRRPSYLRMLYSEDELSTGIHCMEIGLYNDAILASDTDLGTYRNAVRTESLWEEQWCRKDELDFQCNVCRTVPNGGEAISDNPLNDLENAIESMKKMHITYLHSIYDPQVLCKWKCSTYRNKDVFYGSSGYDYIGAHLGYRFVVREVSLRRGHRYQLLQLTIENTGFARAYERIQAILKLKHENTILKEITVTENIAELDSNETVDLSVDLAAADGQTVELWLLMRRSKDNKIIQFANTGAGEALLLGKLMKR